MEVKVSQDKIEGFCHIPGWGTEQSVISIIRNGQDGRWSIGSSMCLPSNMDAAKRVQRCFAQAFHALAQKLD